MSAIRLAIVGMGKIAHDQHLPAIAASDDFRLVATASPVGSADGIPAYPSFAEMRAAHPEVEAVAICTPPQHRHIVARQALAAGCDVLLEKPPAATIAELHDLCAQASAAGRTLFAAWHSRHAPAVAPSRAWLGQREPREVRIIWQEDVRHWHPGQDWIFEAGGLGVFDPGINALSVLTAIMPNAMYVKEATLAFPANRAAPIAASLALGDGLGTDIRATFDFLHTGRQRWDIAIDTDRGRLEIAEGGAVLMLDGERVALPVEREYAGLYERFAQLVRARESDVDAAPLVLAADAFLRGARAEVAAFDW